MEFDFDVRDLLELASKRFNGEFRSLIGEIKNKIDFKGCDDSTTIWLNNRITKDFIEKVVLIKKKKRTIWAIEIYGRSNGHLDIICLNDHVVVFERKDIMISVFFLHDFETGVSRIKKFWRTGK